MTTDCIGNECVGCKATYGLKVEMEHVTAVGVRMNHELTNGNSSSTTLGTKLIETLRAGAWTAVGGNICRTHWCRENSVTECHLAQLDRASQMGVFVIIHKILLS